MCASAALLRILSIEASWHHYKVHRTSHVLLVKAWLRKLTHPQTHTGRGRERGRENILFLWCNQWLCKHTHRAACYQKLSHAAVLQSSTPAWEDGAREEWTKAQRDGGSVAYTHCRDNHNTYSGEGVAFRLVRTRVRSRRARQAGRATGSRQSSRDKQASREASSKASARIPPSHLSSYISSSILEHLPAFSLFLCLHPPVNLACLSALSSYITAHLHNRPLSPALTPDTAR